MELLQEAASTLLAARLAEEGGDVAREGSQTKRLSQTHAPEQTLTGLYASNGQTAADARRWAEQGYARQQPHQQSGYGGGEERMMPVQSQNPPAYAGFPHRPQDVQPGHQNVQQMFHPSASNRIYHHHQPQPTSLEQAQWQQQPRQSIQHVPDQHMSRQQGSIQHLSMGQLTGQQVRVDYQRPNNQYQSQASQLQGQQNVEMHQQASERHHEQFSQQQARQRYQEFQRQQSETNTQKKQSKKPAHRQRRRVEQPRPDQSVPSNEQQKRKLPQQEQHTPPRRIIQPGLAIVPEPYQSIPNLIVTDPRLGVQLAMPLYPALGLLPGFHGARPPFSHSLGVSAMGWNQPRLQTQHSSFQDAMWRNQQHVSSAAASIHPSFRHGDPNQTPSAYQAQSMRSHNQGLPHQTDVRTRGFGWTAHTSGIPTMASGLMSMKASEASANPRVSTTNVAVASNKSWGDDVCLQKLQPQTNSSNVYKFKPWLDGNDRTKLFKGGAPTQQATSNGASAADRVPTSKEGSSAKVLSNNKIRKLEKQMKRKERQEKKGQEVGAMGNLPPSKKKRRQAQSVASKRDKQLQEGAPSGSVHPQHDKLPAKHAVDLDSLPRNIQDNMASQVLRTQQQLLIRNAASNAPPMLVPRPQPTVVAISAAAPFSKKRPRSERTGNVGHRNVPEAPASPAMDSSPTNSAYEDSVQADLLSTLGGVVTWRGNAKPESGDSIADSGNATGKKKRRQPRCAPQSAASEPSAPVAIAVEFPEPLQVPSPVVRTESETVMIFCKRDFMRFQAVRLWKKYQEQKKKRDVSLATITGRRTRYQNRDQTDIVTTSEPPANAPRKRLRKATNKDIKQTQVTQVVTELDGDDSDDDEVTVQSKGLSEEATLTVTKHDLERDHSVDAQVKEVIDLLVSKLCCTEDVTTTEAVRDDGVAGTLDDETLVEDLQTDKDVSDVNGLPITLASKDINGDGGATEVSSDGSGMESMHDEPMGEVDDDCGAKEDDAMDECVGESTSESMHDETVEAPATGSLRDVVVEEDTTSNTCVSTMTSDGAPTLPIESDKLVAVHEGVITATLQLNCEMADDEDTCSSESLLTARTTISNEVVEAMEHLVKSVVANRLESGMTEADDTMPSASEASAQLLVIADVVTTAPSTDSPQAIPTIDILSIQEASVDEPIDVIMEDLEGADANNVALVNTFSDEESSVPTVMSDENLSAGVEEGTTQTEVILNQRELATEIAMEQDGVVSAVVGELVESLVTAVAEEVSVTGSESAPLESTQDSTVIEVEPKLDASRETGSSTLSSVTSPMFEIVCVEEEPQQAEETLDESLELATCAHQGSQEVLAASQEEEEPIHLALWSDEDDWSYTAKMSQTKVDKSVGDSETQSEVQILSEEKVVTPIPILILTEKGNQRSEDTATRVSSDPPCDPMVLSTESLEMKRSTKESEESTQTA